MKAKTKEVQYQRCIDLINDGCVEQFGAYTNQSWHDDPRRTLFMLSRYKFVAKMFAGKKDVLEVGCADAFGSRIVLQEVKNLTAVDFDPFFVEEAGKRVSNKYPLEVFTHNIVEKPVKKAFFNAAYSLDVFEHILPEDEEKALGNIVTSLSEHGEFIIGMPSLESQKYASEPSRTGHVNCKTGKDLKNLIDKYFHHSFLFSMNDEVVHTGFSKMAHYIFVLAAEPKK